jgi:hypothetical protein
VAGRVAQLLKRRSVNLSADESREILEASGIVQRAHLLQVKGPLRLASNALPIEGTGELFIGLPWAAAQQAALMKPVDYVITIENPTSFWRYCTQVEACVLSPASILPGSGEAIGGLHTFCRRFSPWRGPLPSDTIIQEPY